MTKVSTQDGSICAENSNRKREFLNFNFMANELYLSRQSFPQKDQIIHKKD